MKREQQSLAPSEYDVSDRTSQTPEILTTLLEKADVAINGDRGWDIRVIDPEVYKRVFSSWSLGLGESYMNGEWDSEQLDELFTRLLRADIDAAAIGTAKYRLVFEHLRHRIFNLQSRDRAFQVGERHYDAGIRGHAGQSHDLFMRLLGKREGSGAGTVRQARHDLPQAETPGWRDPA
jgi:cyclopropane-fatty-acyl-phospholipid synthase